VQLSIPGSAAEGTGTHQAFHSLRRGDKAAAACGISLVLFIAKVKNE